MIRAKSDDLDVVQKNVIVGEDEDEHHHQHLKMYKPARVLSQFIFNHRKRRNRTLLAEYVNDAVFEKNNNKNIMAIGRLDEDSEGLLLLTTDGKVSQKVRGRAIEKEYWVQVCGQITEDALDRLRGGVQICVPPTKLSSPVLVGRGPEYERNKSCIERGTTGTNFYTTLPCRASRLETAVVEATRHDNDKIVNSDLTPQQQNINNIMTKRSKRNFHGTCNACGSTGHKAMDCDKNPTKDRDVQSALSVAALPLGISPSSRLHHVRDNASSWISITITEGKYRQVRKMTAAVGHPTLRLVRVRIGTITLDGMKEGEVRMLNQTELDAITA